VNSFERPITTSLNLASVLRQDMPDGMRLSKLVKAKNLYEDMGLLQHWRQAYGQNVRPTSLKIGSPYRSAAPESGAMIVLARDHME
jgi:hypothetical protein